MQDLKVTLVQTELAWEDRDANLLHFDQLLDGIDEATNLILLPEMFSTGFSMKPEGLAETLEGRTVAWLKDRATKSKAVVCGSIIIEEEGKYYNRLVWMQPDGNYHTYDKRHLFTMANEQDHYTAGKERLIVELNGWKVCPQVCYDLRFPVWNRNKGDYYVLLFVANWPERRSFAWKNLLQARAIENQAFVLGLNRVGTDGNKVYHSGDSTVLDPLGEILFTKADQAFTQTFTLSAQRLQYVREKFPFLPDRDDFEVRV